MLANYFKLTWRNLVKDRLFTFLNLLGLSTGLACTFLIWLWVSDELKFDKFHKNDSQLFQTMKNKHSANGIETNESSPGILADYLAREMPEVEHAVSVFPLAEVTLNGILTIGTTNLKAQAKFAGSDFFKIFSYDLIRGDKDKVLNDKNGVAISDELAVKLFSSVENAYGKQLEWNYETFDGSYIVAGIYRKPPVHSSIQFDILFNYELCLEKYPNFKDWENGGPSTYLVLKKASNVDQFNAKIAGILKQHDKKSNATLSIRKYSDRYLYNTYENGKPSGGRIGYVKLFSVIALFILVIACINFMNLSTARASRRMKEIGIRKAIGASRESLIFKYLSESMLMSFMALSFAILLANLFLPSFNNITGKQLSLNFNREIVLSALIITFITGIIAGSYPALYLSGFNPVKVLKGRLSTSYSEAFTRKGLVVFQFAISVTLIVCVLVIYQQTNFISSKNLGFNRDHILRFPKEGKLLKNDEAFLSGLKNIPGVKNVSVMGGNEMPGLTGFTSVLDWEGKEPDTKVRFGTLDVGYGLMEMFGYKMKEGRVFSPEFGSDSTSLIFNEAAIESMGLKDPIGKTVRLKSKPYVIIGVVKNFNFESLYEKVGPCFFKLNSRARNIAVKLEASKEQQAVAGIQKYHKQYNSGLYPDYKFLDDVYNALYISEQRVAVLSRHFATLAIIISCLGLFGLAAFTAERRLKEIGIRKVLGATVSNVVVMLSKDFFKLITIAICISFPLSWWMMSDWLESFAYRIDIGAMVFLIAGASIVVMAILTISSQAIKAALSNPVKSLRAE